jgi:hypothetical protein
MKKPKKGVPFERLYGTGPGRCILVTLMFEDGSEREYSRGTDNYILMADSPEQGIRNIAMAGGVDRNVVLLKMLDHAITRTLMEGIIIGPDAAKTAKTTKEE